MAVHNIPTDFQKLRPIQLSGPPQESNYEGFKIQSHKLTLAPRTTKWNLFLISPYNKSKMADNTYGSYELTFYFERNAKYSHSGFTCLTRSQV